MAALAGSCFGFLPYNKNPAKMFMGDTGALFLGYILSTISILGLFKFYAIISFAIPFIVLGLPIIETVSSVFRRVIKGKSPFSADRGHIHHHLIDMGLSQKQSVALLYVISAALGMTAVMLTTSGTIKIVLLLTAVLIAIIFAFLLVRWNKNVQSDENPQGKPENSPENPSDDEQKPE
jgi:UDP-GlcNAc:undecaprenyl-phosphate GlcNAc-1-phosphate transferase